MAFAVEREAGDVFAGDVLSGTPSKWPRPVDDVVLGAGIALFVAAGFGFFSAATMHETDAVNLFNDDRPAPCGR